MAQLRLNWMSEFEKEEDRYVLPNRPAARPHGPDSFGQGIAQHIPRKGLRMLVGVVRWPLRVLYPYTSAQSGDYNIPNNFRPCLPRSKCTKAFPNV